jgi:hypothetical protein
MPEIVADPSDPSCYLLFSGPGIEESQSVGPDPSSRRARDILGRFAMGSSGNPRGRPRGIANPRRPVPNLLRPTAERGGAGRGREHRAAGVFPPPHDPALAHLVEATQRMAGFASSPPAPLFCFTTTGCARARNGWTR